MLTSRHFTSHWKKLKIDSNKLMTFQEHQVPCSYSPSLEDFSILTRENNDFKEKIMDSLLIACDKSVLSKVDSSLHLEIFWYNTRGYHMIFYHIAWCPSVLLWVYNFPSRIMLKKNYLALISTDEFIDFAAIYFYMY